MQVTLDRLGWFVFIWVSVSMPITVTKRDDDFKRERRGVNIVG